MGKINKMGTFGKGVLIGVLLLLFAGVAMGTIARQYVHELHVYKIRPLSTDSGLSGTTPSGVIDFNGTRVWNFSATPNITYLRSYTQLSTWENAVGGNSYYQISAGETVVFDPYAIYASTDANCDDSCATGFATTPFSGVSLMAPEATVATHEMEFKVEMAMAPLSGTSSLGYSQSGLTTATVYGAPSSSVTDYSYSSTGVMTAGLIRKTGNEVQNIQYAGGVTNGTLFEDKELAVIGDSRTYRLSWKSEVSAYVIAETNM